MLLYYEFKSKSPQSNLTTVYLYGKYSNDHTLFMFNLRPTEEINVNIFSVE